MEAAFVEVSLNDLVVVRVIPFQPVVDVVSDEQSPGAMLVEMLHHLVGGKTFDHLLFVQHARQAAQTVTRRLPTYAQVPVFLPAAPGVGGAYVIVDTTLLHQTLVEGFRDPMAGGTMRVEVIQHRGHRLHLGPSAVTEPALNAGKTIGPKAEQGHYVALGIWVAAAEGHRGKPTAIPQWTLGPR